MKLFELVALNNAPQSGDMFNQGGISSEGRTPGGQDMQQNFGGHFNKRKKKVKKQEVFDPTTPDEKPVPKDKGPHTMRVNVRATTEPSPVQVPTELEFAVPAERRAVIDRLVRATGLREALEYDVGINVSRSWHPLQIRQRQFNDHDYRINAPYGLIGLAVNATPDELKKMVEMCELRKKFFMRKGDFDMARMYGNRQDMIAGILSGMTRIKLL